MFLSDVNITLKGKDIQDLLLKIDLARVQLSHVTNVPSSITNKITDIDDFYDTAINSDEIQIPPDQLGSILSWTKDVDTLSKVKVSIFPKIALGIGIIAALVLITKGVS